MVNIETRTASNASCSFEEEAIDVMRTLRASFLGVLQHLPVPIHRAADLERALNLRATLAWQVFRVATAENPLAAGSHVPGSAVVMRVLDAARSQGVPERALSDVEEAMDAFESLVKTHAGDRGVFASMVGSLPGAGGQSIDLAARRHAFRANSQLWGVQVKTLLWCMIWHPGTDESVIDNVSVRGLRDVLRLRRGPLFLVSSRRAKDDLGNIWGPRSIEGDEALADSGPNLLADYCSRPLPGLVNRVEDGFVKSYLEETPLGHAGAQSLYLADMIRNFKWRADKSSKQLTSSVAVHKPAEVLVMDSLIHPGMFDISGMKATVYGSLQRLGESVKDRFREEEVLPLDVSVRPLGKGLSALPTPHIPRYAEIIRSVCARLDWDPQEFEVFRCVINYPILSSVVEMTLKFKEDTVE